MNPFLQSISTFLSFSTLVTQIFLFFLFFLFITERKKENPNTWFIFFQNHGFLFSCITAVISLIGSFFYSEIVGFPPCTLCLIQRGLFFGILSMLIGYAFKKNIISLLQWSMGFSLVGACVAAYSALLQMGFSIFSFCNVVNSNGVSCTQRFVMDFGYITIPMMGLTAFLLTILFLSYALSFVYTEKEQKEKSV